uniref:Uncharacterized protein n=1 Tax=Octopus bimaculoides TaxID=37653 RepID=A0A0L8FFU0_OCTBM
MTTECTYAYIPPSNVSEQILPFFTCYQICFSLFKISFLVYACRCVVSVNLKQPICNKSTDITVTPPLQIGSTTAVVE